MSTRKKSPIKYNWVVLFLWRVNEEYPYTTVPLRHFDESEFPFNLIYGSLTNESRQERFDLPRLPGRIYSVFCKIEKGKLPTYLPAYLI